ncbi:hypothetical protein HK098_002038 [Nowakowskiella sp. JEL0407]|nr:hypothetical protein HK098_002038 [Nowakowskiella sp. JEL0407]
MRDWKSTDSNTDNAVGYSFSVRLRALYHENQLKIKKLESRLARKEANEKLEKDSDGQNLKKELSGLSESSKTSSNDRVSGNKAPFIKASSEMEEIEYVPRAINIENTQRQKEVDDSNATITAINASTEIPVRARSLSRGAGPASLGQNFGLYRTQSQGMQKNEIPIEKNVNVGFGDQNINVKSNAGTEIVSSDFTGHRRGLSAPASSAVRIWIDSPAEASIWEEQEESHEQNLDQTSNNGTIGPNCSKILSRDSSIMVASMGNSRQQYVHSSRTSTAIPITRRTRTFSCVSSVSNQPQIFIPERSSRYSQSNASISRESEAQRSSVLKFTRRISSVSMIKDYTLPAISPEQKDPEETRAGLIRALLAPEDVEIAQMQWALQAQQQQQDVDLDLEALKQDLEHAKSPSLFHINWSNESPQTWISYLGVFALFIFSYVLCVQMISKRFMSFGDCTLLTWEMAPLAIILIGWFFMVGPWLVWYLSFVQDDTFGIRRDLISGTIGGAICTVMAIFWIAVFPSQLSQDVVFAIQKFWQFHNWAIFELFISHIASIVIPLTNSHEIHLFHELLAKIIPAKLSHSQLMLSTSSTSTRLPQISSKRLEELGGWILFAETLDDEAIFTSFKNFTVRDFCSENPLFYQEYRKLMEKVKNAFENNDQSAKYDHLASVQSQNHSPIETKWVLTEEFRSLKSKKDNDSPEPENKTYPVYNYNKRKSLVYFNNKFKSFLGKKAKVDNIEDGTGLSGSSTSKISNKEITLSQGNQSFEKNIPEMQSKNNSANKFGSLSQTSNSPPNFPDQQIHPQTASTKNPVLGNEIENFWEGTEYIGTGKVMFTTNTVPKQIPLPVREPQQKSPVSSLPKLTTAKVATIASSYGSLLIPLKVKEDYKNFYSTFIANNSPLKVNLSARIQDEISRQFPDSSAGGTVKAILPLVSVFDEAKNEVLASMYKCSFLKFVAAEERGILKEKIKSIRKR